MKKVFYIIMVLILLALSGCEYDNNATNAKLEKITVFDTNYVEIPGSIKGEYEFYGYLSNQAYKLDESIEAMPLNSVAPIDYFYTVDLESDQSIIIRFEIKINRKFDFHELVLSNNSINLANAYYYELNDNLLTIDVLYETIDLDNLEIRIIALKVLRRSDSTIVNGSFRLDNITRFRGIFLNVSNRVAYQIYNQFFTHLSDMVTYLNDDQSFDIVKLLGVYASNNHLFISGVASNTVDEIYFFELIYDFKDFFNSDIVFDDQSDIEHVFYIMQSYNLHDRITLNVFSKVTQDTDLTALLLENGAFNTYISQGYTVGSIDQFIAPSDNQNEFYIYGNYYLSHVTKNSMYLFKIHKISFLIIEGYTYNDYLNDFKDHEPAFVNIERHRLLGGVIGEFIININDFHND